MCFDTVAAAAVARRMNVRGGAGNRGAVLRRLGLPLGLEQRQASQALLRSVQVAPDRPLLPSFIRPCQPERRFAAPARMRHGFLARLPAVLRLRHSWTSREAGSGGFDRPTAPLREQSSFDRGTESGQGALQRAVRVDRWCHDRRLISWFSVPVGFSDLEAERPVSAVFGSRNT